MFIKSQMATMVEALKLQAMAQNLTQIELTKGVTQKHKHEALMDSSSIKEYDPHLKTWTG